MTEPGPRSRRDRACSLLNELLACKIRWSKRFLDNISTSAESDKSRHSCCGALLLKEQASLRTSSDKRYYEIPELWSVINTHAACPDPSRLQQSRVWRRSSSFEADQTTSSKLLLPSRASW